MKRFSRAALAVALVAAVLVPQAKAADINPLFEAIPADAWGMVAIPSLTELDQRMMALGQATQNPMAGVSMLMMLKMQLGLFSGVDDNGGAALVLMPVSPDSNFDKSLVIFVPTNNYEQLLNLMQPEDVGGGMSKVLFQQQESYAAKKGGFALIAQNKETLSKALKSKSGIASKLDEHVRGRLAKEQLLAWGDLASITDSPHFVDVAGGLADTPIDAESVARMQSGMISVRMGSEGIGLGLYGRPKEGTAQARAMKGLKPPSHPMFLGLPAERYVVAGASALAGGPAAREMTGETIDALVRKIGALKPAFQPLLASLGMMVKELGERTIWMGIGLNGLNEGEGLTAVTMVFQVKGGAEEYLALLREGLEAAKKEAPEDAQETVDAMVYTEDAEGDVDHLTVKTDSLGASPEDRQTMKKVIGSEDPTFRLTAVGKEYVVVSLGGGAAHLNQVMSLVKEGASPLSDDAGIRKVGESLPDNPVGSMFISPRNGATWLSAVMPAVSGEPLGVELPAGLPPIGAVSRVTESGGAQSDILIPMEVIKAISNAMMQQMQGGPGGQQGGGGQPEIG